MKTVAAAGALAFALMLGGCGDDGPTSPSPLPSTAPTAAPTPTPAPTPAAPVVTGFWDSEARRWHFRLEQQGTTITGSLLGYKDVYYTNPDDAELKITGTIAGSQIDFRANAFGTTFSGTVDAGGSRISGTLRDCANGCRNYGDELVKQ
jgi:hypothetical protein